MQENKKNWISQPKDKFGGMILKRMKLEEEKGWKAAEKRITIVQSKDD